MIKDNVTPLEEMELKLLYQQRKLARRNFRAFWEDLPRSYRMSHNSDGTKTNLNFVLFVIVSVTILTFALGFIIPQVLTTGGQYYHLQPNLNYECPSHDFNGNIYQMDSYQSYGMWYYYCPVDGKLIGVRSMSEPLAR